MTKKALYESIYHSSHFVKQSGLTHVGLIRKQMRLKKSNTVTSLLYVSTTDTKVKETVTLRNQKL